MSSCDCFLISLCLFLLPHCCNHGTWKNPPQNTNIGKSLVSDSAGLRSQPVPAAISPPDCLHISPTKANSALPTISRLLELKRTWWPHFRHSQTEGSSASSSGLSFTLLSVLQSWQIFHSTFTKAFFKLPCSNPFLRCLHIVSMEKGGRESNT